MTKETAERVKLMIEKECCRDSLQDLCEYFLVDTEDFWEFLDLAVEKASENEQAKKENGK